VFWSLCGSIGIIFNFKNFVTKAQNHKDAPRKRKCKAWGFLLNRLKAFMAVSFNFISFKKNGFM